MNIIIKYLKMSAPMESVAFCNIFNEVDFLCVSEAYTEETVIISSKRKLFDVYKISDQKSVKSWSVRHGITLTSPVLWSTHLGKFITVTNSRDVRLWDQDNTDFEKSKKKQARSSIYEAMCVEGYEPVILFSNGSIDFLSRIKEHQGAGLLKGKQEIYWCKSLKLESTVIVLFTVIKEKDVDLHTYRYQTDVNTWHHTVINVPKSDSSVTLCSCDASAHSDTASVYFLWTNGKLSTVTVKQGISSPGPCHMISGANNNSSILALDDFHIAIAGIKDGSNDGLGIFDTKFGLVKSWNPFPDKCLSKPKMCKVRDHLFLPCGTTLYRFRYDCEPSTVISLLGQTSKTDSTDAVPGHYLWNPNRTKSGISQQSTEIAELLSTLTDQSLNYTQFNEKFSALLPELKKIENHHWLSTSHMTTLLQRIMGEEKFWAQKEMCQLIKLRCIPLSIMDELLSFLVQKSEISMLHMMLNTLPNIPEKCICRALSFFFQCDEEKLPPADEMEDQTVKGSDEKQCSCPMSKNRSAIVNEILCLPYSDTFLLECLRKISFKDALKLLEYLCYLLETRSGLLKGEKETKSLSQLQVVDWLCLVLDAHITQFVLSPDCHMAVVKLESIVNEQVQFFDGLVTLEALLEHFKAKSALPQDKKIGHYCIEVLHVY